jgi:hypothetical protein
MQCSAVYIGGNPIYCNIWLTNLMKTNRADRHGSSIPAKAREARWQVDCITHIIINREKVGQEKNQRRGQSIVSLNSYGCFIKLFHLEFLLPGLT